MLAESMMWKITVNKKKGAVNHNSLKNIKEDLEDKNTDGCMYGQNENIDRSNGGG